MREWGSMPKAIQSLWSSVHPREARRLCRGGLPQISNSSPSLGFHKVSPGQMVCGGESLSLAGHGEKETDGAD